MEIRCLAASTVDGFPWCKVQGKDVVVERKTIASDAGFFLFSFAAATAAGSSSCPCSEDRTCPTSPKSSSVSRKPTVAETTAGGAVWNSSGPRGRRHPLPREQSPQRPDREPGYGQARRKGQGDGLPTRSLVR
jgi:hypothetical protein